MAVVNEVTQDDFREMMRQLNDEVLRLKENGKLMVESTSWNAMSLPHFDEDSDEEMEIDEDAVEMLSVQVGLQSAGHKEDIVSTQQQDLKIHKHSSRVPCCSNIASEESDVNMEDCQLRVISEDVEKCSKVADITGLKRSYPDDWSDLPSLVENNENRRHLTHSSVDSLTASALEEPINENLVLSCESLSRKLTFSVSPRVNSSRKSLKTSSMLSASQKDLAEEKNSEEDEIHLSFAHPSKSNSSKALSSRTSKAWHASTEHLDESLHCGLQIINNLRQSSAVRRSSYGFLYRPVDVSPVMPIEKVDVAVQTLPEVYGEAEEDLSGHHLCDERDNHPEILRTKIELKRVQDELNSEKKSMQMVMQGYARLLEQYADLQEKHIALLAKHRRMQEGIEEEKEKRYLMDGNKGLQPQLSDTTEAVQAFEFEPPTYSGYDLCNI